MAYAFIQDVQDSSFGNSGTITLGSNATSGNILLMAVFWTPNTTTLTSVTTGVSSAFTIYGSAVAETNYNGLWQMGATKVTSTGSCTFTLTFSASVQNFGFIGAEYSGADGTALAEAYAQQQITGTSSPDSGSFSSTVNGDLIIGLLLDANRNGTETAGSGFTLRDHSVGGGGRFGLEDMTQATAGSTDAVFGGSGSINYIIGGMAFKPAVGPPVFVLDPLVFGSAM